MIGLIGVATVRQLGLVVTLTDLPAPPCTEWSGFLVQVTPQRSLLDIIPWAAAIRKVRPWLPIGVVITLNSQAKAALRGLADVGLRFDPVIGSEELSRGYLPRRCVEQVLQSCVESAIVDAWVEEWTIGDEEIIGLVRSIAAHGVIGGKAYTLPRRLGEGSSSEATIRRRLKAAGLPSLGWLLRDARLRSVSTRRGLGSRRVDAVLAAGFNTTKLYEKAVGRWRD